MIWELQRKLCFKAKREPTFRFYALYDKVCRPDVLAHAYALAKSNGGAPGVDRVHFADIETYGRERFLAELRDELREKRYRPEAVLRVMIPKPNGGQRPLCWSSDFDLHGRTANLARNRKFETDRRIVDRIR